jgi:hypothetical protein
MNNVNFFFVYSIVFKLLVVGSGIICIVLGYRLYKQGIVRSDAKGATLKASIAKSEIILKNAAPGTFFAVFGAILIGFLVFSSSPEMSFRSSAANGVTSESVLRSTAIDKMASVFSAYDEKAYSAEVAIEKLREAYNSAR